MPTDPRHNRTLPSGAALAAVLRNVQRRMALDVAARTRRGDLRTPDLAPWQGVIVEASAPLLSAWYDEGRRGAERRIAGLAHAQQALAGVAGNRKTLGPRVRGQGLQEVRRVPQRAGRLRGAAGQHQGPRGGVAKSAGPLGIAFDLVNPLALTAADNLALALAQSTVATLTDRLDRALSAIRRAIREGLERGSALPKVTAEVGRIVSDPYRAHLIASTEASRATHAGQAAAAAESGVVRGLTWLASSDACPLCESLNGRTVALGEAFIIRGAGVYSRVEYPPLHPSCMCTVTEALQ